MVIGLPRFAVQNQVWLPRYTSCAGATAARVATLQESCHLFLSRAPKLVDIVAG
jgi:hypothetical protein